jgi:hypothetical protein
MSFAIGSVTFNQHQRRENAPPGTQQSTKRLENASSGNCHGLLLPPILSRPRLGAFVVVMGLFFNLYRKPISGGELDKAYCSGD